MKWQPPQNRGWMIFQVISKDKDIVPTKPIQ